MVEKIPTLTPEDRERIERDWQRLQKLEEKERKLRREAEERVRVEREQAMRVRADALVERLKKLGIDDLFKVEVRTTGWDEDGPKPHIEATWDWQWRNKRTDERGPGAELLLTEMLTRLEALISVK